MDAIGRLFDVSAGTVNVDMNTAGATGKRVSLRNATGCTILVVAGAAASGTESLVFTLKQHTASTGGTTSNLAAVTKFFIKGATSLLGTETWKTVTQAVSQTVTVTDTAGGLVAVAQSQALIAIEVDAAQLADGCAYISLDTADPGAVARIVSVIYILHDLNIKRAPSSLVASLS
jgi:hypothetical protein